MKFVAVEDIAAPVEHVWRRVSDVETFEARMAARIGKIDRVPPGPPDLGTSWSGMAEIMGSLRRVNVVLDRLTPEEGLILRGGTDGVEVLISVDLRAQSPALTRLTVTTDAKASSMKARLMLQSAKLARQRLAEKYIHRVAHFAGAIEASYSPAA
ncbi:MAG: SRPBCC family protein [Pseudomonadota bacterium]